MILFINKEKIKWERDNLIKRNKIQSLIINKSHVKEQIDFFLKRTKKPYLSQHAKFTARLW
jgi:hypothetical protein